MGYPKFVNTTNEDLNVTIEHYPELPMKNNDVKIYSIIHKDPYGKTIYDIPINKVKQWTYKFNYLSRSEAENILQLNPDGSESAIYKFYEDSDDTTSVYFIHFTKPIEALEIGNDLFNLSLLFEEINYES